MRPSRDRLIDSFRRCLVPKSPTHLTQRDEQAIESAILALHQFCEERSSSMVVMENRIIRYWDIGIFDWMTYLFHHYHPLDDSRWTVISYVSSVLSFFISNEWALVVKRYRACFTLVIQLWEETYFDYIKSEYSQMHGWWEPFLSMIQHNFLTAKDVDQQSYINAADTVDLIISRLLSCRFKQSTTSNTEIGLLVSTLSNIVFEEMATARELSRMVGGLADVFGWLVAAPLPSHDKDSLTDWINTCFAISCAITKIIEDANTIDSLCKAISHGLLQSIFEFSKQFKYAKEVFSPAQAKCIMEQHGVLHLLTDYIPMFICYRSVLKVVQIHMENNEFRKQTEGSAVEEPWKELSKIYQSTIKILKSKDTPRISLCDNPTHGTTRAPANKLYRCSGCEFPSYCSVECQKEHWDTVHRKDCTKLRLLDTSSTHDKVLRRDYISVCRLAIGVLRIAKEWKKAEAIAKRKYPLKNISQLTMVMNFSSCEPEVLDVVTRNRAAVSAALAVGPQATVIQCIVPLGTYVATVTAAGDISKKDMKAWYAGRSLISYSPAPITKSCAH